MMTRKNLAVIAVLMSVLAAGNGAHATLIGSNVGVEFYFPDLGTLHCSSGTAIVGAGVEFPVPCGGYSPNTIDITANQVIFSSVDPFSNGAFNGFVMSILTGPAIASVAYNAGQSTMTHTSLSFDAASASFNFAGNGTSGVATFDIVTGGVPLPATLPLLALGLAGLGWLRQRRRRA